MNVLTITVSDIVIRSIESSLDPYLLSLIILDKKINKIKGQ